jgi:hypothetical protein
MPTTEPTETIVCIYCKQTRAPSREQVLPASLGGDVARGILCRDCGRRLSAVDQALAERSFVALSRAAATPKENLEVRVGAERFIADPSSGLILEVDGNNSKRGEPVPQVHVVRLLGQQATVTFAAKDTADFERLASFVDEKLASSQLRSMHVKLGPEQAGPTARLAMHRERDAFVRAQSQEDADLLFRAIETDWARRTAQHRKRLAESTPAQPTFDHVYRAVAKTAFNFAAAQLGSAFLLAQEFDDLRRYVLGDDVRHASVVAPGEVAVDKRFVTHLPYGTDPVAPTEGHAVTLFYDAPVVLAWVTLYKSYNFIVRLGDVSLPESVFALPGLSSVRRGIAALAVAELASQARR